MCCEGDGELGTGGCEDRRENCAVPAHRLGEIKLSADPVEPGLRKNASANCRGLNSSSQRQCHKYVAESLL